MERIDRRLIGVVAVTAGVAGSVGALAAAGLGTRHVLMRQAATARAIIGKPLGESAPAADKRYKKRSGEPIQLLVLGDSIAAGLGADRGGGTLGARLAKRIAKE